MQYPFSEEFIPRLVFLNKWKFSGEKRVHMHQVK